MAIALLRIANFRNLAQVELQPVTQGLNVIYGANGSGKTSLLEAIYFLSLGRSFRTSNVARLIKHEEDKFSLFAQNKSKENVVIPLGMERERSGGLQMRAAEQPVASIAELAALIPVQLIHAQSHHLLEAGPQSRRKYIDWGLFYQYPEFLSVWRHFERALKQRNCALRDRRPAAELAIWTQEVVHYGNQLSTFREAYVAELSIPLQRMAAELLGVSAVGLSYQPGWLQQLTLQDALQGATEEERRLGYTLYGPHRADLQVSLEQRTAKHFLSRGQQKLLICAMLVAQGNLLVESCNKSIIYLVDDLPAELDDTSRTKLLALLLKQQTQVFLTAIASELISQSLPANVASALQLFHVEHGGITQREWKGANYREYSM